MEKEKMTKLEKQWVLYDVGNSAFVMLVSTIIPIYFKNMATASGISAANSTAYGKDVGHQRQQYAARAALDTGGCISVFHPVWKISTEI